MTKKKTEVLNEESVVEAHHQQSARIELNAVKQLEEAAKVGFYCEKRQDDDQMLEPHVRLMCESKDGESEDTPLTPWCTVNTLSTMIEGCLYLHPLLLATIKDRQKNAENPE